MPVSRVVSVVVAAHPPGAPLHEAPESVRRQSLAPAEVVIVDDGRLDRAIEGARGPWIALLDPDDPVHPTYLESALGVARATGAALVVGSVGSAAPDRRPDPAVRASQLFFHKELWRSLGGFRPHRRAPARDFLLRALAAAPSRVVFEPTLAGADDRVPGSTGGLLTRIRARAARPFTERALAKALQQDGPVAPLPAGGRAARPGPAGPPPLRCGLVVGTLDAGGLEEVVALLATELPGQGVETHVLCTASGGRIARRLSRAGVPVTVARSPGARRSWLRRARPDVLSTHFTPPPLAEELAQAGIPLVETVHNAYAWFSADDWRREGEKQRWLRALVAVSRGAAAYYRRRLEGPTAPVTLIPNGVVPDRVPTVPRAFARRLLGLHPDAAILVQLGRIEPQKNQLGALAAFREIAGSHPGSALVLAGAAADEGYAARLRREFADLFDAGRARILPPRPDVGTLLSAADAYVSDSWFEGWSLGASEALWTGLPLVVSDTGGALEMVGEDGARGCRVPNPLGDPLDLGPAALADAAAGRRAADPGRLAPALDETLRNRGAWAARRPEILGWARTHLPASRVAADYAALLRNLPA